MGTLPIYNCHIHTFTLDHVPERFIWVGRVQWLKHRLVRFLVLALLYAVNVVLRKFTPKFFERLERLLDIGSLSSQEAVFEKVWRYYPTGTRFVVLPMDMAHMGAGKVPEPLEDQQATLMQLARQAQYAGLILPFCAVDPRCPDVVGFARRWIKQEKFCGIKLYPRLGYAPDHPALLGLYQVMQDEGWNVPVMAHCSTGPQFVGMRGLSEKQAADFGHPQHYEQVLKDYPKVRFCLAHFGGGEEWERQLLGEEELTGAQRTWVRWIRDMLESGDYPNLYTDVSMTIFDGIRRRRPVDYLDYLKVLLSNPRVHDRVLYGSDYYMVKLAKLTEKEASILLRSRLGEELYLQIAHYNPIRYLYG